MAKLIVLEGPDSGCEHELPSGDAPASLTAGRDPRAELPLNDSAVSRRHFQIERSPRGWRLVDLGSRNLTFLNGETVRDAYLKDMDVIRAGDTELRFESPGDPLEPGGAASTILKELPAAGSRDTFLVRLEVLEGSLGAEVSARRTPAAREALARARKVFEAYGVLAATTSAADLFAKLLAEGIPALGADRGAVLVREGPRWTARASWPQGAALAGASSAVLDKVLLEAKAVLSSSAVPGEPAGAAGTERGASLVAAPILLRGKPAGAFCAERDAAKPPFLDDELELLVALADPAGALLERLECEEHLRAENLNLFRSLAETKRIVGRSPATLEVLEFIRRAAPTSMTVLVQGETGTGKELVASAIHYASPRRGKPFVAINCAGLPENLVESELFGHERGAFTG
ncbi:MAG: sigma 54-interacting transcriptional regulator, partial [Planctomycetes bacterium]|nr:sigma 54-interacting transcriptional regulator [Planctomycetota bacterium]